MSIPLEHKPSPSPAGETAATGALDELRAVYDAIESGDDQTEVFDVAGTHVAVRYRRLGYDESLKTLGGEGSFAERNAQFLIDACDEILYRDPETGDLGPVVPGARVTFDWRPDSTPLHEALGRTETDIRRSVLRLFKGAERVMLLHAQEVDAWMDTLRTADAEAFTGG